MSLFSPARLVLHLPDFESPRPVGGIANPHTQTLGFAYSGTAGDDSQTGTLGDDGFDYSQGGNDTLNGLDGADEFTFGGTFNYLDKVDGGTGYDRLILDGDYSGSAFQWTANTLVNVEEIDIAAGNSYDLFLDDGTVAAGQTLFIDAHAQGSTDTFFLDGDFETDGSYIFHGGAGADELLLGGGTDHIFGRLYHHGFVCLYQQVASFGRGIVHTAGNCKHIAIVRIGDLCRDKRTALKSGLDHNGGVGHSCHNPVSSRKIFRVHLCFAHKFGDKSSVFKHFLRGIIMIRRIKIIQSMSKHSCCSQIILQRSQMGVNVNPIGKSAYDEGIVRSKCFYHLLADLFSISSRFS